MSRGVRDFDLILCVRAAPCGLRAPVGGARAVADAAEDWRQVPYP